MVSPHDDKLGVLEEEIIGKGGNEDPILTSTLVKNNETIAFGFFIGNNAITSGSGTEFSVLSPGDKVRVTGSASNDGDFTVSSVDLGGARIIVSESIISESAGESITIIKL